MDRIQMQNGKFSKQKKTYFGKYFEGAGGAKNANRILVKQNVRAKIRFFLKFDLFKENLASFLQPLRKFYALKRQRLIFF